MTMKKQKILIVDDEETQIEILTEILLQSGFEVESACDGKDALTKLVSEEYDIAIIDEDMPYFNGSEIVKALKDERGEDLPIMFSLSFSNETILESKIKSAGFDHLLPKPFELDKFRELLNKKKEL